MVKLYLNREQNHDISYEDGHVVISSIKYKIGSHGLVFMYLNGEWVRSQKSAAEIRGKIKALKMLDAVKGRCR